METFGPVVNDIMGVICNSLLIPVVVILLILAVYTVFYLGSVIFEFFTEHRHFKVFLPKLIDDLQAARNADEVYVVIRDSGLLLRQKKSLIELTNHQNVDPLMLESLAIALSTEEHKRYEDTLAISKNLSRFTPMLGLMGTLIPLAPGLLALGLGDTETLSASLTTAFNTTILGVAIAAIMILVTWVHTKWYSGYRPKFDAAMECVVTVLKNQYLARQVPDEKG
jgi:biopolymer transport protein ExbB/TolQ